MNVTSNPDFILTEPAAFPEINAGGPVSFKITAAGSFNQNVAVSCSSTSFAAGTYSLSITGTSGSVVHTLAVTFNVGDYSVSGTQALSLSPGGQGQANLTLASSTFYAGKIDATCDASALSGAMCALSPPNPIALTSGGTANLTATVNIPNNANPGVYDIHITSQDTTGAPSHPFVVRMTVAQDFVVTSSTPSQSVTAGQTTGPYNLTVQPVGSSFSGAVTLACSAGLPAQAQCLFSPSAPVTPGTSAVNVVMSISTTARNVALRSHSSVLLILYAVGLLLPGIVMCGASAGVRAAKPKLLGLGSIVLLVLLSLSLVSCGGVSTGGGAPPPTGNQPVIYHVTVTGSSPGTAADPGQSVQVLLVVN